MPWAASGELQRPSICRSRLLRSRTGRTLARVSDARVERSATTPAPRPALIHDANPVEVWIATLAVQQPLDLAGSPQVVDDLVYRQGCKSRLAIEAVVGARQFVPYNRSKTLDRPAYAFHVHFGHQGTRSSFLRPTWPPQDHGESGQERPDGPRRATVSNALEREKRSTCVDDVAEQYRSVGRRDLTQFRPSR